MLFALVEVIHCAGQHFVAHIGFLRLCDDRVLQRRIVLQPILPLAVAILAHRHVERRVPAHRHAAVHAGHFRLGHAKIGGDLGEMFRLQITILERVELRLHAAQVEEQLFLGRGRAHFHETPRAQDIFLDRGADPPHRIGGEAEATIGLELLHTLHQADIAFGNQFRCWQAIAAIAHRDLRHEAQMRRDELRCRIGVTMFLETLGEHVFLLGCEDGEFLDFRQIAVEARLPAKSGDRGWHVAFSHDLISL